MNGTRVQKEGGGRGRNRPVAEKGGELLSFFFEELFLPFSGPPLEEEGHVKLFRRKGPAPRGPSPIEPLDALHRLEKIGHWDEGQEKPHGVRANKPSPALSHRVSERIRAMRPISSTLTESGGIR